MRDFLCHLKSEQISLVVYICRYIHLTVFHLVFLFCHEALYDGTAGENYLGIYHKIS